ncbi:putative ISXo8 transposase [Xanthomonas oryzae pv. oryzae KACC 10331]|uniref:ISXo8 transposase n=1 Tax=Xanthomonas oryzae pv. oryzae (strain KACC10331 / KXO85) TaxID=291331 RepID=Q5H6L5_XANOR|nr:putative ISXo8 transposase [Xanthomonas oryzae pv. oryzae KACC 10331]
MFLVAGRGFFLRANIWTPLKLSENFRSQEERVFSYRNTHDHNFHFMTVGYHGPGYETNLYQYDPSRVRGYIGEVVELESLGRTMLQVGRVMVYREKVDVHTQFPPEQLSVSLNLMVTKKRECEPDQYFFDPSDGRIVEMPQIALVHKRASIVALAGQLANSDTADVIESLIIDAPCRRVREAALVAASTLSSTVLQIIVSLCHYWKTFRPRGRAVLNRTLEVRFEQYGEVVAAALSHADRKQPAHWYLKGLLLPGGRKSVEPMAARVHPQGVRSAHQSMHHLVAPVAVSS